MGWTIKESRFDSCRGKNCCFPKHTDRQWGPSNFLFSGQQGFFPRDKLAECEADLERGHPVVFFAYLL